MLGKKWSYPLIYSFTPKKEYSFNTIARNCRFHVNRTLLSQTLKDLVAFSILRKKGFRYSLTEKGEKMQHHLKKIKDTMLGGKEADCSECVIKRFRFH